MRTRRKTEQRIVDAGLRETRHSQIVNDQGIDVVLIDQRIVEPHLIRGREQLFIKRTGRNAVDVRSARVARRRRSNRPLIGIDGEIEPLVGYKVVACGIRQRKIERVDVINEPVAAVISGKEENRSPMELLKSLEDVGALTEAVIAEADAVHKLAQDGDWQDIARDTDTLKQQLQSARNKVLVAQRNIAARAPS